MDTTTPTNLTTPNVTSNTGIQVKIPSDIPASTFNNAPANLAIPNIPTPTVPDISSDSALQQAKAYVAQIQPEQSQAEKDRQTFVQQYKDLLDTPAKESATAQAYKDTGINDLVAKINDYTAQITAIDDMNEAKKLSIGQNVGGLTVSGVQNEEARINRESAIKKLSISASLAAVQGKFNTAKSLVDQAITIKYADQQAKIDRVKAFLELNKEDIGREDKKQTQILAERQRILDEKKANDKAIGDMIINAASANAPSALVAKAQAAKTPSEAAAILGLYAGDYWATKTKIAQYNKTIAETNKINNPTGTEVSSDIPSNSPAQSWLDQYNSGAMSLEDIYTKIGSSKTAEVVKNDLARLVAAQGGKRVLKMDDAQISAINEQIKNIDDLIGTNGYNYKVISGASQGGALGFGARTTGAKADALAIASNLVANQTLQSLADAKAKGVTFGALSGAELNAVASAASRIASKAVVDKETNKITGFSGSEVKFLEDLNSVKKGLEKSITQKTGSVSPVGSKVDKAVEILNSTDTTSLGGFQFK